MTPEQKEKLVARLLEIWPMTREEAEAFADGTARGLQDRADGKRIPLSQVIKDLGLDA
ncbi:hypothetical protein LCGC14_1622000 [marine sediment metagenome]|uniref:Uncharacterized protein n=1 Tax=marine sediment metagenome TaxID=412755 RepID=A0A0F9I572_9ZZZZ